MIDVLILWDIDGTLLNSGGAGIRALSSALEAVFGVTDPLLDIEFAGRTDPWIVRQVLAKHGISISGENRSRFVEGYIKALPGYLSNPAARVLPGVRTLLEQAASRADTAQGLLTGNIRRGAAAKLGYHGLWDFFPVGAFADDSEFRDELGPHALRRARRHWGVEFPPGRVWVVGDTVHDIACARAIGARALAVATGGTPSDVLASRNPDALFEDLGNPEAFWRIVG